MNVNDTVPLTGVVCRGYLCGWRAWSNAIHGDTVQSMGKTEGGNFLTPCEIFYVMTAV